MTSFVLRGLGLGGRAHPDAPATAGDAVLVLTAALVFVGALIHVGAAVDHYREFPLYTLVFSLLAAGQIAWAALLLRAPSRRVLLAGCGFELAIVALWALSRTAGVPIAPAAWVPEKIGVADLAETVGECVAVIAMLSVAYSSRLSLARAATRSMAPIVLATLLITALFGTAVHAG
jgi:hypothetical protein